MFEYMLQSDNSQMSEEFEFDVLLLLSLNRINVRNAELFALGLFDEVLLDESGFLYLLCNSLFILFH